MTFQIFGTAHLGVPVTDQPHSDEYLLHQAREFHSYVKTLINQRGGITDIVANLAISVEYLIELMEKRCATP